jgi:hypothetical protein
MESIIENRLFLSVAYFFAFMIFIYMPMTYLWIGYKNKKAVKFASENSAVRCYIKRTKISDILTIHSVNDEKPAMFSTISKIGFYVPTGENIICVSYAWQPFWANLTRKIIGVTNLLGVKQHLVAYKKLRVVVKLNTEYELSYDHGKKRYIFIEKQQTITAHKDKRRLTP